MKAHAPIPVCLAMLVAQVAYAQERVTRVELPTQQVRLRDIASGISAADALGDRTVARIAPGQTELLLGSASIDRILRAQAPTLRLAPRQDGAVIFVSRQPLKESQSGPECSALAVPVSLGEFVSAEMLTATDCAANRVAAEAFTFDREARSLRASADLPAGTFFGRIEARSDRVLAAGSDLILRTGSGPVVVERKVRTIQPARSGERVFVAADDGSVLVGQLEGASQ